MSVSLRVSSLGKELNVGALSSAARFGARSQTDLQCSLPVNITFLGVFERQFNEILNRVRPYHMLLVMCNILGSLKVRVYVGVQVLVLSVLISDGYTNAFIS
jgi:hypothetical protein